MAEEARRHLRTLGLQAGASAAEVKQAYRELAHIWHPDNFANAPHLREVAQVKMAEINAAYQFLKRGLPETGGGAANTPASTSPHPETKRRADYTTRPEPAQPAPRPPEPPFTPRAGYTGTPPRQTDTSARNTSGNSHPRPPGGSSVPLLPIVHALNDSFQPVMSVAFSPDGTLILAASGARIIWWNAETGKKTFEIRAEKGECPCLVVSPGGRSVVFANNLAGWFGRRRSELRLCDLQTGREQRRWKQDGHVMSLAWSRDGKQIAAGDTNGFVRFWEPDGEREIQHLAPDEEDTEAQVRRVAYVDGHYAAKQVLTLRSGQTTTEIGLWEVRRARRLKAYTLHIRECLTYGQIGDALPSPDGSLLLVANNDPGNRNYSLHLWDVATGFEIRAFRGHTDNICGCAWSADGQRIASCGEDKTVCIWNVADGTELARGLGHTRTVRTVAFAPNGKTLASGGDDRTVCVWRLPP